MKLTLRILIILFLQTLFCRLSVKNIQETFNKLKKVPNYTNKIKKLEYSIGNPIYGYLFELTGGMHNIRFYGPNLTVTRENEIQSRLDSDEIDDFRPDKNGLELPRRMFDKDKSSNSITNFAINLFPSANGILYHIENSVNNFGYQFSKDKRNGISFLTDLLIKLQVAKHTNPFFYEIEENTNPFYNKFKFLGLEQNSSGTKHSKPKASSKSEILNDHLIKSMIIHSFIINALDSSEDLELYLKNICGKIELFNEYDINCDIIEAVYKAEEQMKEFPYNGVNQPISDDIIPIYNRNSKKYDDKTTFSDSVGILLLHICNCVFYNSESQRYSTGTLDEISDLAKFYKKNNKLFTITNEIMKEWSKVIQDLPDFDIVKDDKFKTHLIVYENDQRNKLKPGIINMMNVLIKICNIDHFNFWWYQKFNGSSGLQTKILSLIKELSKISGNSIGVEFRDMLSGFMQFKSNDRIDFLGEFYILFKDLKLEAKDIDDFMFIFHFTFQEKYKMKICHSEDYSRIELVKSPLMEISISSEIKSLSNRPELPLNIAARYFSLINENHNEIQNSVENIEKNPKFNYSFPDTTKDIFKKLYFSRKIETNTQKKDVLKNIFKVITDYETNQRQEDAYLNSDKVNLLKYMTNSILSTVVLDYYDTLRMFRPYLLYTDNIPDSEIFYSWIESLNIESSDQFLLYESKVLESKTKHFNLNVATIRHDRIQYMFEFLNKMESLKQMKLRLHTEDTELNVRYFLRFSENLGKLKNITKIDLSNNFYCSVSTMETILSRLKELTNLTWLNFGGNYVGGPDRFESYCDLISKLTNLEYLDLARNKIGLTEPTDFQFMRKKAYKWIDKNLFPLYSDAEKDSFDFLKNLKNLKELNLSYNKIQPKLSSELADSLKELKKLTIFDISSNFLKKEGAVNIITSLSNLTNLETINIGDNQIGDGEIEFSEITLSRLRNLKSFNIKKNRINDEGIESFMKLIATNAVTLSDFDASENDMSKDGAKSIANVFKNNTNLISFIIGGNFLTFCGIGEILQAIEKSKQLKILDISANYMGNVDFSKELLNFENLEILDISNNEFYVDMQAKLNENLKTLKKLKKIKF